MFYFFSVQHYISILYILCKHQTHFKSILVVILDFALFLKEYTFDRRKHKCSLLEKHLINERLRRPEF